MRWALRLAVTGGIAFAVGVLMTVGATIASAVQYNLAEPDGYPEAVPYTSGPPLGILLPGYAGYVITGVGVLLSLVALLILCFGAQRHSSPRR